MTRAIDHCSTIHHTAVPSPAAAATPNAQIAAAMLSESGEALARVPMLGDIVMPTRASNIGATVKEESRWNRPNPTENAPAVATSAANGWPTTKAANQNDHDRRYGVRRRHGIELFPLQLIL